MSEEAQTNNDTPELEQTEMAILKKRADVLGVKYSNNIGIDTLRERVRAAMEGEDAPTEDEPEEEEVQDVAPPVNPLEDAKPDYSKMSPAQRKMAIRRDLRKSSLALVRVRITNLNPAKKNIPGEILTVANNILGTVRRYIPFGEQTEDGWHVEQILLDMMRERKFLQIKQKRDKRTGVMITSTDYVREFAIEVLEPLTQEELDRLARTQAAADNA